MYSYLPSAADLSIEPIESSSLEREEKLDALIGGDRVSKDNAIGERFCGTKDASNSDRSVFSGTEKAACRLNVPGKRSCCRVYEAYAKRYPSVASL